MRKITVYTLILMVLMLSVTQLASAQWMTNTVRNQTTEVIYVVWSTAYPAVGDVSEAGYRTSGWVNLLPDQQEDFWGFSTHRIYFLILKGGDPIKPNISTDTVSSWVNRRANFDIVAGREINASTDSGDLLYSSTPNINLTLQDGFVQYRNGSSINVTSNWVDLMGIPILGPGPRGGSDDDVDPDEYDDIPVLGDDGMTVIDPGGNGNGNGVADVDPGGGDIDISISSGSTTLNQGSQQEITLRVRDSLTGEPITDRRVILDVPDETATLTPNNGETDSSGTFTTILQVDSDRPAGILRITVQELTGNTVVSLDFNVEIGAGKIDINVSPSTIEPGQTSQITFTTRTHGGDLFPNVQLSLAATSGNINPTLVTTNAQGQATATFRANPYSGTPRPGGVSSPKITATVVDNPEVKAEATLTVTYTVGGLSSTGIYRNEIRSGQYFDFEFTVRSQSGTPLSGVSVSVSESDSEIRFTSLSGTTDSSGEWVTRMQSKGKGSASFTARVPGSSLSKTVHLTVLPWIREATRDVKHDAGCRNAGWLARSYNFDFPGKVVSYTIREEASWSQGSSDYNRTDDYISWNNDFRVVVKYNLFQDNCRHGESWAKIWVDGSYEETADSFAGAPSLPSQRYEEDLSLVAAHPQMQLPAENALLPNYPNPFNPETWIPYHLSEPADVTLSIYSADGKLVRTLALGHQPAGVYENKSRAAYWDGRNAMGERVASGLYFYTLTAGDFAATGKMLIMK